MNRNLYLGCFMVLVTSPFLHAQDAELNGSVRDSSGSVIPKADVRIVNKGTGASRTTQTNGAGLYVLQSLLPGAYQVEISAAGFKKFLRTDLELHVAQKATLDFTLEVGNVQESISVSAGNETLETSTTQLGTVITPEKIVDLPLNARNFTELITLTPGAIPISVGENNSPLFVAKVGQSYFPAINGQSNRSNTFTLDGVYNNGNYGGTYALAPNIDALSEFKVQSQSDQAEFGGVTGGVINVVTKSGGNEYHGSAYEFLRNDALDSRGFFTARKPSLRQNQFGATLGGPVRKEKTFFFFSYEGYRQVNPTSALTNVPTPQQLSGDFSGPSRQIFNPFSTRVDPANNSRFLRDPFPGNIIPAALLNPSTQEWAKAVIPAPINTGFSNFNMRNNDPQRAPFNQYSIRGDHRLTKADSVWFRYTRGEQNLRSANAGLSPTQICPGGGSTLPAQGAERGEARQHVVVLGLGRKHEHLPAEPPLPRLFWGLSVPEWEPHRPQNMQRSDRAKVIRQVCGFPAGHGRLRRSQVEWARSWSARLIRN